MRVVLKTQFNYKTMNIRCKITLNLLLCVLCATAFAQKVDTVSVTSPSMNIQLKNIVILPEGYRDTGTKEYPVLYLLHGHGGDSKSWLSIKPSLPQIASQKEMIIVCPDGKTSWYWDSPKDPSKKFETYISKELISYIDSKYNTRKTPKGRAIAGLSMGGHGALWLAIRHPDIYGACGSMSGGVDIRPFPNNWNMSESLGSYKENPAIWDSHTVINQLHLIQPGTLAIIFDCGTDDFFFQVNEDLHRQLLHRNIKHDYITRPGGHTGTYWANAAEYQILFFSNFFSTK